jgi:1-aminocyclopropane-1-carboxylate deaminase/D-cysteine desulfhydrase-like pyridoxal-dependent ACC family enzyme
LIYTGKAFFALVDQLRSDEYDSSTVLFVHTGGLMNG